MRLSRLLLVSLLLLSTFATRSTGQDRLQNLQQQLIDADRGIWQAVAGERPKMSIVSQALAPDYIDMENGICTPRQEVLKYLEGITEFSFRYAKPRAFSLSDSSGYVIAELTYSSVLNGKRSEGRVLTTTVFSQEHGRWLAHLHTEMDIKPQAGSADK